MDPEFDRFIGLHDAKDRSSEVFSLMSLGLTTNRDKWCYNSSRALLVGNVNKTISHYSEALKDEGTLQANERKISLSRGLLGRFRRGQKIEFNKELIRHCLYRPFQKQVVYFSADLNEYTYQLPHIFPNTAVKNLVIQVSGTGARAGFAALMMDSLPNLHTVDSGQCFPLYLYEKATPEGGLFSTSYSADTTVTRRDAINNVGLEHFQSAYPGRTITKEDLFYYIYGLLHSPDYRIRFKNNLAKQLPRIPAVKAFNDFAAFRDAGRALGDLHVNFETVDPYMVTYKEGDHTLINDAQTDPVKFYRVKKMKFGGRGKDKDCSTVIYNDNITMQNIPLAACDYVVNGKPALEWVMERQVVKTDKASAITNDANDYANETVGDPRYPLELFQRVITVSLETMKIVNGLPELEIE